MYMYIYIYIYTYIYIYIHDLQVNVLLTKIFVILESFLNYLQTFENRRVFFNCYY